jgi:hypothetical protein
MTYPNLNRRHKVGFFLVLVAAGISLLFEASAKQTAGVILLGVAATWLLGTVSVRLLWLLSSFFACLVGIIVGGKPVVDDWRSFQESVQSYDRAVADLREAMRKSRPLHVIKSDPLPRRSEEITQTTPAVDYDALAKKYGAISSSPTTIDWSNYDGSRPVFDYDPLAKKWAPRKVVTITPDVPPAQFDPDKFMAERHRTPALQGKKQKTPQSDLAAGRVPIGPPRTQGKYTAADINSGLPPLPAGYTLDVTVEIPANTVNWERPDLGLVPPGATLVTGSLGTRLSFPTNVDEEELISTIQNQLLQPRPRFSLRNSLKSNLFSSVTGFSLLVAGLLSLGWFVRNVGGGWRRR